MNEGGSKKEWSEEGKVKNVRESKGMKRQDER